MERVEAEVDGGRRQRSGVHIRRCRRAADRDRPIMPTMLRTRWAALLSVWPRTVRISFDRAVGAVASKLSEWSTVHLGSPRRCRYLAESSCAGMCVNLCKSPTQVRFPRRLRPLPVYCRSLLLLVPLSA